MGDLMESIVVQLPGLTVLNLDENPLLGSESLQLMLPYLKDTKVGSGVVSRARKY